MGNADRAAAMDELYGAYAAVPILAELAHGKKLVRGHGPLDSPFMVVGEAPGAEEERRGRPFVGPSGQLLQELFKGAGVPWAYCYVTNAVSWRPPGNRTPYPFEVQASHERIAAEVALIDPVVIVAAGAVAWRGLTRNDLGRFEDARFGWHDLGGRRLLALPHPSYLLRLGGLGDAERAKWEGAAVGALRQALQGAAA